MGINRKGLSGPVWNALGSGMYAATTFLLLFFVSRRCGADSAGIFSVAFTNAQLLYIVGVFGAHTFHMTDYGREYSFSAYFSLRVFTCLLMVPALLGLALVGEMRSKLPLTAVLTLFMAVSALAELWQSEFFRRDRLDLSGQSLFFRNLISTGAFLGVLALSGSAVAASLGALVANVLSTACFGPLRMARLGPEARVRGEDRRALLLSCLPLFISTLLMTVLPNCSKYVMDYMASDLVVGHFSMILMPVQFVNLLAGFIFRPYLKRFSDCLSAGEGSGFLALLRKNALLILLVTAVSALAAYLVGIPVLSWLYKAELSPYRLELTGAVLGGGALALSTLEYYLIVTMRRQRSGCLLYAAATALCAVLNVALIKAMGVFGGILSCLAAYTLLCAAELVYILFCLRRTGNA